MAYILRYIQAIIHQSDMRFWFSSAFFRHFATNLFFLFQKVEKLFEQIPDATS